MSDRLNIPELWADLHRQGHRWPHPVWRAACHEQNARDLEAVLASDLNRNAPVHTIRTMVDAITAERTKAAEWLVVWAEQQEVQRAA